jgi:hypothetical protein
MPKTSDIYKNLYHYTTWDGLLGILRSKKMWATHYKFLNDYTEITLFRDRLVNLILPHVKDVYDELIKHSPHAKRKIDEEGGLNQVVRHDTEAFVDAQYHATGNEIYIVSFCGEHTNPHINSNGLLSQWRGYGPGGGFAIVFDTQKLEEILSLEVQKYEYGMIHLSDVVYSGDEKKLQEEFYESLTVIADDVRQVFNKLKAPDNELVLNGFQPFATCISRYKHHGYCEENEVRIVALPTVVNKEIIELAANDGVTFKPDKERKFREKSAGLVPYIEIFDSPDIDLPIKRIIVGPHKEKESRAATLRVMLRNTGIEIHCSDIPFTG